MKIVTGWSRGGLGYVADLLRTYGHKVDQSLFLSCAEDMDTQAAIQRTSVGFEVSSLAVPHLDRECFAGCEIYFILRDPMRVLNSLNFLGTFSEERIGGLREIVYSCMPEIYRQFRGRPVQATAAYIVSWLQLADKKSNQQLKLVRLEDGPAKIMEQLTGQKVKVTKYSSPTVNSSGCCQTLLPSMLPDSVRSKMLTMLHQLGYKERIWFPRGGHSHYVNPDWHC